MRCLYCGKELALLRRLTRGEFCSDAHRQQYKEEYNQLALNRLLQAKNQPKTEEEIETEPVPAKTVPSILQSELLVNAPLRNESGVPSGLGGHHATPEIREPEVVAPVSLYLERVRETEPVGKDSAEPDPAAPSPATAEPIAAAAVEEPAPAGPTGFVIDMPIPVLAGVAQMEAAESDLEHDARPSLPFRDPEVPETHLFEASQVVIEPSTRFRDHAIRTSERGPEMREFGRGAPGVEMNWPAAGETALDTSEEPMEILIFPHPPQDSARLWEEPETEFEAIETELGAFARIILRTTGIEDHIEKNGSEAGSSASSAPVSFAEESREGGGVAVPEVAASLNGFAAPAEPAAAFFTPQPVPAQEPVPDLVTKPLPLTLHGLAAGRGKPVPVFSATAAGFEVEIPRSGALPLRPLMILNSALAPPEAARKQVERAEPERSAVKNGSTTTDSWKLSVARPDSRPDPAATDKADARARQAETRRIEKRADSHSPVSGSAILKEQPGQKQQPGADAAVVPKSAPKPAAETKPEKIKPESRKATPEAPAKVSNERVQEDPKAAPLDLGLPSLDLKKPSGSLWSRIPMPAKIGASVAVLILAGVAVTASMTYFAKRGPRVVEVGPALPVSGWVNDWDTGPQVQVTVLRGTSNLSDYRAQFQAQINTKAVGWVFRARDAKNFYASKLEVVKSGAIWTAVLARFVVIDGREEPRAHVPLSLAVQENTVYRVRLEVVGDHFSTWIQDQKVDEFTDGRIRTGGVGLYSERGESALLKGDLSVIPLAIKK